MGGLRGASIVDSLDTLYIMGLMEEYNDAKEWVETSLDLNTTVPQPPGVHGVSRTFSHRERAGRGEAVKKSRLLPPRSSFRPGAGD
ncbi:hypothetical protein COCON_G00018740 [Conger conger]|uniref:Alpha-1,2-Mannosidase n=1 Tax=Conger conger TaxID=82655 RepID=A0A9Q1I9Q9_CONCO|nr:hypothetical protein COCON_G00018740 [Conger conger]